MNLFSIFFFVLNVLESLVQNNGNFWSNQGSFEESSDANNTFRICFETNQNRPFVFKSEGHETEVTVGLKFLVGSPIDATARGNRQGPHRGES